MSCPLVPVPKPVPIPVLAPNGLLRLKPEVGPKLKLLVFPSGLAPNTPLLAPKVWYQLYNQIHILQYMFVTFNKSFNVLLYIISDGFKKSVGNLNNKHAPNLMPHNKRCMNN